MKNIRVVLLILLLCVQFTSYAKIWRVNNNAGIAADFATLDEAVAAYAGGDTIHLEPSVNPYTVSSDVFNTSGKQLTIIGNGYFLIPLNPFQQDTRESVITAGVTAVSVNADISFAGIVFNAPVLLTVLTGPKSVNNVKFEGCKFNNAVGYYNNEGIADQLNGILFLRNYMQQGIVVELNGNQGNLLYNFRFENNIITGAGQFSITPMPLNHDVLIVRNNVFGNGFNCYYSYCANNIFPLGISSVNPGFNGCTLKNNIFMESQFATNAAVEVNNIFGVDMSTVFATVYPTPDWAYALRAGSPAVGAGVPNGTEGVDCGAFGGPNPYRPGGMPSIPSIPELNVPPSSLGGTDIHISIRSVSNN